MKDRVSIQDSKETEKWEWKGIKGRKIYSNQAEWTWGKKEHPEDVHSDSRSDVSEPDAEQGSCTYSSESFGSSTGKSTFQRLAAQTIPAKIKPPANLHL